MLAVHWTPVKNTKAVLKNGIAKSKNGLYCFPLTGHKSLDRWWIYFFNQCGVRNRKKYNGIVFRIREDDLPAYFGHWIGATTKCTFEKEFATLKGLQKEFRNVLMWRLGEMLQQQSGLKMDHNDHEKVTECYMTLATEAIRKSPVALAGKLNDLDLMTYSFEDYQIVLSHAIPAKRIIKVMPQGNEFGRVIKIAKTHRIKHRKAEE